MAKGCAENYCDDFFFSDTQVVSFYVGCFERSFKKGTDINTYQRVCLRGPAEYKKNNIPSHSV